MIPPISEKSSLHTSEAEPETMPPSVERELDRLYSLRPSEFVAARQEVARALRQAGDREGAEQVKAARRPTLAAWSVNQLARTEKRGVRTLLNAGKRLRTAQGQVLRGGRGEALRHATDEERDAIRPLLDSARGLLSESGQAASESTLEQVEKTLHAAARDEGVGQALLQGRLTRELDPTGFGIVSLSDLPRRRGRKEQRSKESVREKRRRERASDLRQQIRELRRAVNAGEDALAKAQREADAKELSLRQSKARLARAEAALERLEG
jgi:hypothetical protein